MKKLTEKQKKDYDDFVNEQFRILKGHFERIMLRCYNKLSSMVKEE